MKERNIAAISDLHIARDVLLQKLKNYSHQKAQDDDFTKVLIAFKRFSEEHALAAMDKKLTVVLELVA